MDQITDRVKCTACGEVNPGGSPACKKCGAPLPIVRVKAEERPAENAPRPQDALQAVFFKRGQVVANRYTVLEMIGRGGMGCIYKVHDNVLKEEVALKTLLPQFVKDKMVVERFYNEARIARNLSHPNIVRVHDIGMAGNILYISMEFLEGRSMRAMLDSLSPGTRLDVAEVLRLFEELCGALEYAHQFTVHRDLKPENVMIAKDGSVKLMDFGISKLVTNPGMTATSVIMGTPHYMSPEQLKDSGSVDARADIYSMGVMLYEVMTGNVPVGVPKPASQITREVPQLIDDIIARCLEPNPTGRYATATELRRDLRKVRDVVGGDAGKPAGTSIEKLRGGAAASQPAGEHYEITPASKWPGYALLGIVLLVTLGGVAWNEARWKQMGAEVGVVAPNAPPAQRQFSQLEPVIAQAAVRAKVEAGQSPGLMAAVGEGEANWGKAKDFAAVQDYDQALRFAALALRSYAAPIICPDDMVYIPSGTVTLRDETGATADVSVSGFFMDEREVTRGAYETFALSVPNAWPLPPGFTAAQAELPVTNVTAFDALAFAAYQNKSLPTEAQWARAAYGVRTPDKEEGEADTAELPVDVFPWGTEWKDGAANVGSRIPKPVASFADDVSIFGVHDVVGNVSEWTLTESAPIPYDAAAANFSGLGFGDWLCLRGGDFVYGAMPMWTRREFPYAGRDPSVGFRCVKELPQSLSSILTALRTAVSTQHASRIAP